MLTPGEEIDDVRANGTDSLDGLDAALGEVDKVVIEGLDFVPVRHEHGDAGGHALDVRLVVDGVVEEVIEQPVDLLELDRVVVWETGLLEVFLEVLAVALELLAIGDNGEGPVPSDTARNDRSEFDRWRKRWEDLHVARHWYVWPARVESAALLEEVVGDGERVDHDDGLAKRVEVDEIACGTIARSVLRVDRDKEKSYHISSPSPGTSSRQCPGEHRRSHRGMEDPSGQVVVGGSSDLLLVYAESRRQILRRRWRARRRTTTLC